MVAGAILIGAGSTTALAWESQPTPALESPAPPPPIYIVHDATSNATIVIADHHAAFIVRNPDAPAKNSEQREQWRDGVRTIDVYSVVGSDNDLNNPDASIWTSFVPDRVQDQASQLRRFFNGFSPGAIALAVGLGLLAFRACRRR